MLESIYLVSSRQTQQGFQDDNFMERPTAKLCRLACQHGWPDDEEIQKRAIPQVRNVWIGVTRCISDDLKPCPDGIPENVLA